MTAATAPGPPSNLQSSVNGNTVTLSWTKPSSGDPVTSYVLEAGSASGLVDLANFNTGNTQTSLTAPGVTNGVYYVRVRAVSGGPFTLGGTSPPSNEVIVTVGSTGGCPTAPRSLNVVSQSAGTIKLTWLAPSSGTPTSYVIVAGSAPGLSNLANFDTGSTATSLDVGNVPAGSYYVRVYAKGSGCGLSAASNEVLVFVVGVTGDVQVSVAWDAASDLDLHVVEPLYDEEIYWGNQSSRSGGQLEVDSNGDCVIDGRQIESIRWAGSAPTGTYKVRVDYYRSCGVARTNYVVTVSNRPNAPQTFSGFFTGDGDKGGLGSGTLITSFIHFRSQSTINETAAPVFRAPQPFMPSAAKLKGSGSR
ncbi:MAG: fibronectin type III domain-containing protein [Acidobacteria bacterium]|nr:fibronectin type III domain-containing protein [Acidobacteriota bacterium]